MFMDTNDDFVGYSYTTLKGSTITVVGRSLERPSHYYSKCSVCNEDAELFPELFLKDKNTYNKEKVFCGCANYAISLTPEQWKVKCQRSAEQLSVEFLGFKEEEVKSESSVIFKCNKGHVSDTVRVGNFAKGKAACIKCSHEVIAKKNSIKWVGEKVTTKYGNTLTIEKEEGKHLYLSCDICSKDKELYPSLFRLHKSDYRVGKVPCGCSVSSRRTKEQYRILCNRYSEDTSYSFVDFHGDWKGIDTKIIMDCPEHGTWDTSNIDKLLLSGRGCPSCAADNCYWGLYKGREQEDDYLYYLLLSSEDESFIKVGRSFYPNRRIGNYKSVYNVEILAVKKATHQEVFDEECFIKKTFKDSKYSPNKPFGGSITECFIITQLGQINTHFEGCFDSEITQQYRDLTNL
ncbi:endonuclease [Pseudoalteromonas phage H101]|uniref:CapR homology domain-containing protein n=1 Tax=Pseudoalteromonas phage H101 TaxID=1654919 RepID=A0A0H4J2E7_9CAUD|nr:endonuclease [Pseudoalteromonas phage H101]AKO61125.1 hypothetical protein [Pseudoalteromonas phage H101]